MNEDIQKLTQACQDGDLDKIRYLVKRGADVNKRIADWTPLTDAILRGYEDIVDYLILVRADINKIGRYKHTPLILACYKGHENMVKYLILAGADINRTNRELETPLMWACINGYENVVKYLVERGADVNRENYIFETPLTVARENRHKNIEKYLTSMEAEEYIEDDLLVDACILGNENEVIRLITLENKKRLINKMSREGITPLVAACQNGNKNIIKYLVENGADVNRLDKHTTPLSEAIYSKDGYNIVKYLVERGADVNLEGRDCKAPIMHACSVGDESIIEYLIDCGADFNIEDSVGKTPLTVACEKGYERVVNYIMNRVHLDDIKELVIKKKNISRVESFETRRRLNNDFVYMTKKTLKYIPSGNKELLHLCKIRNFKAAKLLIKYMNKDAALAYACETQNNKAIKLLLELGVNKEKVVKSFKDYGKAHKRFEHNEYKFKSLKKEKKMKLLLGLRKTWKFLRKSCKSLTIKTVNIPRENTKKIEKCKINRNK